MIDTNYFYLVDLDGNLYLHKKGNFRQITVFKKKNQNNLVSYSNFSLTGTGLDSKKIIAIKRLADPDKIWPESSVEVLESRFDEEFE